MVRNLINRPPDGPGHFRAPTFVYFLSSSARTQSGILRDEGRSRPLPGICVYIFCTTFLITWVFQPPDPLIRTVNRAKASPLPFPRVIHLGAFLSNVLTSGLFQFCHIWHILSPCAVTPSITIFKMKSPKPTSASVFRCVMERFRHISTLHLPKRDKNTSPTYRQVFFGI